MTMLLLTVATLNNIPSLLFQKMGYNIETKKVSVKTSRVNLYKKYPDDEMISSELVF